MTTSRRTTPPAVHSAARRWVAVALAASLLAVTTASPAVAAPAVKIKNPDVFEQSAEVARWASDQYGPYGDRADLARINDIAYRVAQESGFTDYPLTFHLIAMPEPNAFALPGGHIFITRGMMQLGLDDDMLACLLGHEIAHVVLDHHTKMKRRATLLQVLGQALLVGVLIGASGDSERDPRDPVGNLGRSQQRGEMVQGAAAASVILPELLLRNFSREHEDQADAEGQRWAAGAGFDPQGANRLFAVMEARIPQSKKYGYWATHPFFDERVRSGRVRAELLKVQDEEPADDFRLRTQATIVTWMRGLRVEGEDDFHEEVGLVSESTSYFVEDEALAAWPEGEAAEAIRLAKLHRLRDAEIDRPALERDYGEVIRAYLDQEAAVTALTPESPFLARLATEKASLQAQAEDLYPRARAVLEEGIFETGFLERFLSNWGEAPEVPRVALLLGDAHSRLGNQPEAVRYYLRAVETADGAAEGERAARGLKVLAPELDSLSALQGLALQERDAELAGLAEERLTSKVAKFDDVDNGADYLDRYPDGPHVGGVGDRMNVLADKLYAEVLLYQAVGDHGKAIERINKILTYAPLSPAAELLRDRAVLEA